MAPTAIAAAPVVYLTPKEVAARFQVCARTVTDWSKAGRFVKPVIIGRKVRYPLAAIEAFERGQTDG
jgi:hypothetical protein